MDKKWFIKIQGKEEGPFNYKELKRHPFLTPDTLVRKKNQMTWIPIRFVAELKEIFEDSLQGSSLHEPSICNPLSQEPNGQELVTLTLSQDPFQFVLWFIILLIILSYIFYRLYA